MKKQTFVVEITTPEFDKSISINEVIRAVDSGMGFPDWRIDVKEVE